MLRWVSRNDQMKDDANIKVPREAWERTRAFALHVGRDLREVTATAMTEYVTKNAHFENALQRHTGPNGPKK